MAAEGSTAIPLSRMRRAVAVAMTASAQVPQFTIESDVRAGALVELREQLAARGIRLSFVDFFVAACARALREHPQVNASFGDDAILRHAEINIGLAVALEDGL